MEDRIEDPKKKKKNYRNIGELPNNIPKTKTTMRKYKQTNNKKLDKQVTESSQKSTILA